MPLLDDFALAYTKDTPCVILEIGHSLTKIGIAGESLPRRIIPSVAGMVRVAQLSTPHKAVWQYENLEELNRLLTDFFHEIFFKCLLVNPKERKILIVESVLCPLEMKQAISKVLFMTFEAQALLFAPAHLLALFTLGIQSGLVLDVGHCEALVVPVYEGESILRAWQAAPLAMNSIQSGLRNLLTQHAQLQSTTADPKILSEDVDVQSLFSDSDIQNILLKACFITTQERAAIYADGKVPESMPPTFEYHVDGDKTILLEGCVRELPGEVMFQSGEDDVSLASLILDSILACPLDTRRSMADNIVVIGGTSMLPGFMQRLRQQLLLLVQQSRYSSRFKINEFKFHTPPGKRNYTSWLGGAIFAALDILDVRAVSRDRYLETQLVPDWSTCDWTSSSGSKQTTTTSVHPSVTRQ